MVIAQKDAQFILRQIGRRSSPNVEHHNLRRLSHSGEALRRPCTHQDDRTFEALDFPQAYALAGVCVQLVILCITPHPRT